MIKPHSFKLVKLLLGIFLFFLITYLFFELIFHTSSGLELFIKSLPASISAAFVIVLLLVADIFIPIPASIVMVVSGVLFGGFLGGLIALTGSLIGSIINFQVSRTLGQTKVKKWLGDEQYSNLIEIMQKYGAYIVILTRMVPLVMESVSSIAGISNMKLKNFIILNIIGFTPIIFLYSYTGALYKKQTSNILIVLVVGFFVPLIIWYVLLKIIGKKH